ncbi:hypothetical protein SynSYN20_01630 [Synechococcus sp. SYN20]|nr:hypothetical protein [Synechococcus sp. SYN20]QNJ25957.1 hypothetical protein SynSYN20_01630 [Synechococcus sp. SYN20]
MSRASDRLALLDLAIEAADTDELKHQLIGERAALAEAYRTPTQ